MLEIDDLHVRYRVAAGLGRSATYVHAVNGASLAVPSGSAVGVVGERAAARAPWPRRSPAWSR